MRLDELVLRVPGDEFRVRFHPQLTVLAGIGMLERQALVDGIVGAMTGTAGNTTLRYTDATGCPIEGQPPIRTLGLDADALRALVLVQAGDLATMTAGGRPDEDAELAEARSTLATIIEELQAAMGGRQQHELLTHQLQAVERDLRAAEDGTARREYAKVLADLERVRAEAAALQGGDTGADSDRALLTSAADTRELIARWRTAAEAVAELRTRRVRVDRLEPDALVAAQRIPDAAPADLRPMLAQLETTQRERDALESQLREHAASSLPAPSDPRVVDLAAADQSIVWAARDRVLHALENMEREQFALGGTGSTDRQGSSVAIDQLEDAHRAVEDAERALQERRPRTLAVAATLGLIAVAVAAFVMPLLGAVLLGAAGVMVSAGLGGPARRVAAARKAEQVLLDAVGVPTYLSFHLRRVDASVLPGAHERLEASAREHRAALHAWALIMPSTSVEQAVALEAEARSYARSLADLGDKAGEIEDLRRALTEQAEPAYEAARQRLAAAMGPYQLDGSIDADPDEIARALRDQIALGRDARAQRELEAAEATEQALASRLDERLNHLGFHDGGIDARAGALEWTIERATEREQARTRARSQAEVDGDLARLQDEIGRLRRPEWASVQAAEANLPEPAELRRRRDELRSRIAAARHAAAELERLADRHSAMERRVAALEAKHDGARADAALAQVADVQEYLLAHMTRASHVGPMKESVPVVFDEPFLRIPAERKWELLDLLRRIADQTQIVYLTDDPFVGAWARRRAASGTISLLEPVEA